MRAFVIADRFEATQYGRVRAAQDWEAAQGTGGFAFGNLF